MTSSADPADLAAARAAAARLLAERGYPREAAMAAAGEGDDFSEVRTALALLAILAVGAASPIVPRPPKPRNGHRLVGEEC